MRRQTIGMLDNFASRNVLTLGYQLVDPRPIFYGKGNLAMKHFGNGYYRGRNKLIICTVGNLLYGD